MAPNPLLRRVGEPWAVFPWEPGGDAPVESGTPGCSGGTPPPTCLSREGFPPSEPLLPGKGCACVRLSALEPVRSCVGRSSDFLSTCTRTSWERYACIAQMHVYIYMCVCVYVYIYNCLFSCHTNTYLFIKNLIHQELQHLFVKNSTSLGCSQENHFIMKLQL